MVITSKENELIKHIKKLKEKKYRDEYGEFIVEGSKMINEAINENAKIKYIIVCDDCKTENSIEQDELYEIAKHECIYVSKKIFDTITDVQTPQGIMAVVEKPEKNDERIDYKTNLFLILDNISDPGNMGTILRTADSLNMKQIIVSPGTADCYNSKVVRSTMGAIFRVKVIKRDLEKVIKELKKHDIKIFATDLKTDKTIYDVDYNKTAVIIGNEANGVSENILNLADEKIKIPMPGKTESLNAAVATGIIMYEAFSGQWGRPFLTASKRPKTK